MGKSRWATGVTERDLADGIRDVEQMEDVRVRYYVYAGPGAADLCVECQIYRETEGVRLGLAKNVSIWNPSERPLMSVMLIALHRAYGTYKERAYTKPSVGARA